MSHASNIVGVVPHGFARSHPTQAFMKGLIETHEAEVCAKGVENCSAAGAPLRVAENGTRQEGEGRRHLAYRLECPIAAANNTPIGKIPATHGGMRASSLVRSTLGCWFSVVLRANFSPDPERWCIAGLVDGPMQVNRQTGQRNTLPVPSITRLSRQIEGLNPRLHKEKQTNAEISHSLLDRF